jgi:hypothetical protein
VGDFSLAAGFGSVADHRGSFVWADFKGSLVPFVTAAENQFLIRADGGVGIGTNSPSSPLTVAGTIESTTGGVKFPDGTTQTSAAWEPVAAAVISPANGCTVVSGTPNVTCESFDGIRYVLDIGEPYDNSYVTTVTRVGPSSIILTPPLVAQTIAYQGKLHVAFHSLDGSPASTDFSMVTFKP